MNEVKVLLGKILGEIYRLQDASESSASPHGPAHVYGLLHGIEHCIDHEIEIVGQIPNAQLETLMDILEEAQDDPSFRGYYDIENRLENDAGIDRSAAIQMLTYLKASGRFTDVITKMNSEHSPVECKNFDIGDLR